MCAMCALKGEHTGHPFVTCEDAVARERPYLNEMTEKVEKC